MEWPAHSRLSSNLSISAMTPASAPSAPVRCKVEMTIRRKYAGGTDGSKWVCELLMEDVVVIVVDI